ncbi:flagellar filament protein [Meridianimarinicoccus roseus]|jgi:flagellin|uniref:Flagellin n=1 Tax=Meridianimarinicoccus roseus TaxID=2072018 RepID=A0A2V2LJP0_9RHOB|nr:flagellin [Meridianimarinicoccus roseus]PWR02559.1 flagellar filament protein [Meridianimarinicoccus roseus]
MTTINTNIGAIQAQSNMTRVNNDFNQAMSRLSSGMRINAAKDDAAGMAIAEKMTSQIKGLNQAVRNATDGKSLVDTTEGAHVEVSNMLQRLRELAVQSSNDTNTAANRNNLSAEGKQLIAEINSVAENTTFNGMKVLDGSFSGMQLQIGADKGQTLEVNVESAAATDIGANTVQSTVSITDGTDSAIAAGTTITLTGYAGSDTVTTTAGQSAKSLADEVNKVSAGTGIEATAITKAQLSGFTLNDSVSFDIGTATGETVNIGTVSITDANDVRGLRDAINAVSGQTGITAAMAENDNSAIVLTDANGDDIILENATSSTTDFTVTALTADGTANGTLAVGQTTANSAVTGEVEMSSTKAFTVATDVAAATEHFGTAANGSSLETVAAIDLSTADGAADAIKVIDYALQKISQSRSDLGAVSNRLDSTISNLTNITVNVESARSGVMDADFAKESSALARGQILSQAATAMLAQANSSQQNVMSLLRG